MGTKRKLSSSEIYENVLHFNGLPKQKQRSTLGFSGLSLAANLMSTGIMYEQTIQACV